MIMKHPILLAIRIKPTKTVHEILKIHYASNFEAVLRDVKCKKAQYTQNVSTFLHFKSFKNAHRYKLQRDRERLNQQNS